MKKTSDKIIVAVLVLVVVFIMYGFFYGISSIIKAITKEKIHIISSTDNQDIAYILEDYGKTNDIKVEVEYAGTLEIMEKLNSGEEYDAVWASNSMWLYMLENIKTKDSKIISMNPVVFGIKKQKAEELGFVGKDVRLEDILNAIKEGKLKFAMTSATQTNTGACAYLGFLSVLAGNPEILTEEYLNDESLKEELMSLFNGVTRSSGSEEYLEEMYLNGECDALVTYETSIINMNSKIDDEDDTIYAIYTTDGVSISDSVFAYLGDTNTENEEAFLKLQSYLLSENGQEELMENGRRVWYGGVKEDVDKDIFNPNWGIDTTKYIVPTKFPSTQVIKKALGVYQSELRKPTHIVFALDYSGSMSGTGCSQLREAMNYILDEDKAGQNFLQFSSKDKISFIFFESDVDDVITIEDGTQTQDILNKINSKYPGGGTNIYGSVAKALEFLDSEDSDKYNLSVVIMTDGEDTAMERRQLTTALNKRTQVIPVYAIMFGYAEEEELEQIVELTTGKVFDGRYNLLNAFKIVRGYN